MEPDKRYGCHQSSSQPFHWFPLFVGRSDCEESRLLGSCKKKGCRSGSSGGNGSTGGSGGSGGSSGSRGSSRSRSRRRSRSRCPSRRGGGGILFFSSHIASCPGTGTCCLRQVSRRVLRTAGSEDADGEPRVLCQVQFSSDAPEPCLSAGLRGHVEKGSDRASRLHEGLGGSDEGRGLEIVELNGDQSLESLLFHHLGS